jgi:glycosyltransferase involved in cell wall biosynthesis
MTIFIAMPTLEDSETKLTIQNAYDSADMPDDVYFGIACTTSKEYYEDLAEEFQDNPNVKIKWFDSSIQENLGIGKGRNRSLEMYDNQKYVLQIDSHTLFKLSWDSNLINLLIKAQKQTGSDKTILTSYLPIYKNLHGIGRVSEDMSSQYAFFTSRIIEGNMQGVVPNFKDLPIKSADQSVKKKYLYKPFIPAVKFNANFAFSNHEFAKNSCLPEWTFFWEEEIVQTINLLDAGFSLVFPNRQLPLAHLYSNDVNYVWDPNKNKNAAALRTGVHHLVTGSKEDRSAANWQMFLNNPENQNKIAKFHKWSGVHPTRGPIKEWLIPDTYNTKDIVL